MHVTGTRWFSSTRSESSGLPPPIAPHTLAPVSSAYHDGQSCDITVLAEWQLQLSACSALKWVRTKLTKNPNRPKLTSQGSHVSWRTQTKGDSQRRQEGSFNLSYPYPEKGTLLCVLPFLALNGRSWEEDKLGVGLGRGGGGSACLHLTSWSPRLEMLQSPGPKAVFTQGPECLFFLIDFLQINPWPAERGS